MDACKYEFALIHFMKNKPATLKKEEIMTFVNCGFMETRVHRDSADAGSLVVRKKYVGK